MSPRVPADLLEHLTLEPEMSPTSDEIKQRAIEVRDVLSSFDRDIFPSEYRNDVFANLDRPISLRPQQQSEWTIQQDLGGTLLQWGTYDEKAYQLITRLQDATTRTRCFHEKLKRRFGDIFSDYDALDESMDDVEEVQAEVNRIAQRFAQIIIAVQEDRRHRELDQHKTAGLALGALIAICLRSDGITLAPTPLSASAQESRRSPSPVVSEISIFRVLMQSTDEAMQSTDEAHSGGRLVLDLLESYSPVVLRDIKRGLEELESHLKSLAASSTYIVRIQKLLQRTEEDSPAKSPSRGDDPGAAAATEVDPTSRAGSSKGVKRTASQRTSTRKGKQRK